MFDLTALPQHIQDFVARLCADRERVAYDAGFLKGRAEGTDQVVAGLKALSALQHPQIPLPAIVPAPLPQAPAMLSHEAGDHPEIDDLEELLGEKEWTDAEKASLIMLAMAAVQESYEARGKDPSEVIERLKEMLEDAEGVHDTLHPSEEKANLAWIDGGKSRSGSQKAVWDQPNAHAPLYGPRAERALQQHNTKYSDSDLHTGGGLVPESVKNADAFGSVADRIGDDPAKAVELIDGIRKSHERNVSAKSRVVSTDVALRFAQAYNMPKSTAKNIAQAMHDTAKDLTEMSMGEVEGTLDDLKESIVSNGHSESDADTLLEIDKDRVAAEVEQREFCVKQIASRIASDPSMKEYGNSDYPNDPEGFKKHVAKPLANAYLKQVFPHLYDLHDDENDDGDIDESVNLAWTAQQTRGGSTKAVWDGADGRQRKSLYGKAAASALNAQSNRGNRQVAVEKFGNPAVSGQGMLDKITKGELPSQEEWEDFQNHLPHLRVHELKELREKLVANLMGGKKGAVRVGKSKADRLQGIKDAVQRLVKGTEQPRKETTLFDEPQESATDEPVFEGASEQQEAVAEETATEPEPSPAPTAAREDNDVNNPKSLRGKVDKSVPVSDKPLDELHAASGTEEGWQEFEAKALDSATFRTDLAKLAPDPQAAKRMPKAKILDAIKNAPKPEATAELEPADASEPTTAEPVEVEGPNVERDDKEAKRAEVMARIHAGSIEKGDAAAKAALDSYPPFELNPAHGSAHDQEKNYISFRVQKAGESRKAAVKQSRDEQIAKLTPEEQVLTGYVDYLASSKAHVDSPGGGHGGLNHLDMLGMAELQKLAVHMGIGDKTAKLSKGEILKEIDNGIDGHRAKLNAFNPLAPVVAEPTTPEPVAETKKSEQVAPPTTAAPAPDEVAETAPEPKSDAPKIKGRHELTKAEYARKFGRPGMAPAALERAHKEEVQKALKAGKEVPSNILAEHGMDAKPVAKAEAPKAEPKVLESAEKANGTPIKSGPGGEIVQWENGETGVRFNKHGQDTFDAWYHGSVGNGGVEGAPERLVEKGLLKGAKLLLGEDEVRTICLGAAGESAVKHDPNMKDGKNFSSFAKFKMEGAIKNALKKKQRLDKLERSSDAVIGGGDDSTTTMGDTLSGKDSAEKVGSEDKEMMDNWNSKLPEVQEDVASDARMTPDELRGIAEEHDVPVKGVEALHDTHMRKVAVETIGKSDKKLSDAEAEKLADKLGVPVKEVKKSNDERFDKLAFDAMAKIGWDKLTDKQTATIAKKFGLKSSRPLNTIRNQQRTKTPD